MLEDKLEISIITYNRAPYLERTLSQLVDSPFARCKITILDNCSSDETPTVCARFQPQFPAMQVVRHQKNVGACPNYLKAVEMSQSTYTWVLCDDDEFDFSDCADVIEAIERESVDLVAVGSPYQSDWPRGTTTTSGQLFKQGYRYFATLTFIPGLIFKTALFDSQCMAKGYRNSTYSYPHFEFITKSLVNDFSVHISKRQIVNRDAHNDSLPSSLFAFTAWVGSCSSIPDPRLRRLAIYEAGATRREWLKNVAIAIAIEKIKSPEKAGRRVAAIALQLSADQFLRLLLLSPLLLMPSSLLQLARRVRRDNRGLAQTDLNKPFDDFRL